MNDEADRKNSQLESLNQQLDAVKKLKPETRESTRVSSNAAKAAIDFASAIAVGSLLGYGIDAWQHCLPWGTIGGFVIGTCAGIKLMLEDAKPKE